MGMSLYHHFFHLPFLSGYTSDPTVAFSPGILAMWRSYQTWKKGHLDDDDWLPLYTLQKWLGRGPLPDPFYKAVRITEDDIPEMYQGSKFKYLFSIPAKGYH